MLLAGGQVMLDAKAHQSIGELMERLRPFIARRLSSAADVDDVLQDVLLQMQRHVHELRDSDRLGPWLYRITRNAITDRFRAEARSAGLPERDAHSVDPDDDAELTTELARCVAPLVARLPSPYREAVTMVDLEDLTFKDAAAAIGLSVPGMKSRVQRGRSKLRELFEECCRLELDVRRRVVDYECRPGQASKCTCGS
jgi:RNA polymerase sigma-70 factor (ECF subfamily)